jgi:hypothetical protein
MGTLHIREIAAHYLALDAEVPLRPMCLAARCCASSWTSTA